MLSGLDPLYLNVDVDVALAAWTRAWTLHVVGDREASLVDAYLAVERAETLALGWRRDIVEHVVALLDSVTLDVALESIARRYVRALRRLVSDDAGNTIENARVVDVEFVALVQALETRALNTYAPRIELLATLRRTRQTSDNDVQRASVTGVVNVHRLHVHYMYGDMGAAVRHSSELARAHALSHYRAALDHAQHELALAYTRLEGALVALGADASRGKTKRLQQ